MYLINKDWKDNNLFYISGIYEGQGKFRIPWIKRKYWLKSEFFWNNLCIPGARIHFKTDAKKIRIEFNLIGYNLTKHMSIQSISGVEIYEVNDAAKKWIGCFSPNYPRSKIEIALIPDNELKKYEILLPSYAPIMNIKVKAENGNIYKYERKYNKRIVVYGSSISQGCAASRPANSYTNIISDKTDAEIINFGLSGSARGEEEVINIVKKIKMDAFIMEYDHNATIRELQETHYHLYKSIRKETKAPIIMLSRLSKGLSNTHEEQEQREKIIKDTYCRAIQEGDTKVFYICGNKIIEQNSKDIYFADDRHPNDLGMYILANVLINKLKEIWEQEEISKENMEEDGE